VNASARNLDDLRFPEVVDAALRDTGLDPGDVELEITENTVMAQSKRTLAVLNHLRDIGVGLSIDDFGTGYSSLANLRLLPIDELKIDRSFVRDMADDRSSATIVRSIVELAHNLRLTTVAEGVENVAVLSMLGDLGCTMAQGYLIARPGSASAVSAWFRADGPSAQPDTTATSRDATATSPLVVPRRSLVVPGAGRIREPQPAPLS
jgi:EAL domain-containing protein (putative c-di-GMP-specific phosphodiesterase class I)